MDKWTPTEISMFVSLMGASIAVVLHAIQRSRCTEIRCGCIECVRAPPPCTDEQSSPPRASALPMTEP